MLLCESQENLCESKFEYTYPILWDHLCYISESLHSQEISLGSIFLVSIDVHLSISVFDCINVLKC